MREPIDTLAAPGTVRLRPMRPEDLDRAVEIEKSGFRHPWSRDLLARELSHAWSTVLVAEEDPGRGVGGIVGFIVFWLVHDEVHVLNVATAPEARRRGIGRALMDAAVEAGRKRGARLATLEVRRTNVPAIALYRALGYRQIGIRPNYYADEGEDAIVMLLDL